jgi:RNA polymerase sigma-70 factor (ECF subfamily)
MAGLYSFNGFAPGERPTRPIIRPRLREEVTVVVSPFLSMHGNTSEACDLREWSEQQLVAAAKIGRSAPFGELCKRHQKRVFAVVQRMMRNREDAEDAVQDCLLNAFTHMKDFDERSMFSTWLIRIAINAALAKLRKKRRIREVPVNEPDSFPEPGVRREIQDPAPDPEEAYHLRERKKILNTAVAGLRPRARDVVEIYELQEHSVKKTAEILGISTTAVKTRMFHARVALHRMPLLRSITRSNRMSAG